MAANLSLVMDDTDKVRSLFADAVEQGLEILPPDVNASWRFEPVDTKHIRYGLGGIKGTGEQAIASVVAARTADGPFRDLFEFCRRVDKRLGNRRVIEALVKAGAFDSIDPRRATLFASVGVAIEAAEHAEASAHQVSLFRDGAKETLVPLVTPPEWTGAVDPEKIVSACSEIPGEECCIELMKVKEVAGRNRCHGMVLGKGVEIGKNIALAGSEASLNAEIGRKTGGGRQYSFRAEGTGTPGGVDPGSC